MRGQRTLRSKGYLSQLAEKESERGRKRSGSAPFRSVLFVLEIALLASEAGRQAERVAVVCMRFYSFCISRTERSAAYALLIQPPPLLPIAHFSSLPFSTAKCGITCHDLSEDVIVEQRSFITHPPSHRATSSQHVGGKTSCQAIDPGAARRCQTRAGIL